MPKVAQVIIMAKKKSDDMCTSLAGDLGGEVLNNLPPVKFFVDTGNLALNYICSGRFLGGGFPGGKIIEMYGPESSGKSLWGMNVMRGTQAIGGICVYLDCENALNSEFAANASHVDLSQIVRFTPDCLEAAFHKIYNVIRIVREKDKERPIVFVYDSISVSPSERELRETTVSENPTATEWKQKVGAKDQPGERAKIVNKELRKLESLLEKNNATILIINQIRMKIGVMFGCFFYHSKVLLANGEWMSIGKIVNNKLPLEVMSFNLKNKKFEPKKIVDWHCNGDLESDEFFLKIKMRRGFDNAFGYMMVTPNHQIYRKDEKGTLEDSAGNLKVGDKVLSIQPYFLTDEQLQLVYGSILGDGCLKRKTPFSNPRLALGHSWRQRNYLKFKANILKGLHGKLIQRREKHKIYIDSKPLYELTRLMSYKSGLIPQEVIDNLDVLGLAIWYLDDGSYGGYHEKYGKGKSCIYCKKFKNRKELLKVFQSKFGLNPVLKENGFFFNTDDTYKLHNLICRFVPKSMEYKIHPHFHGLFDFVPMPFEFRYEESTCEVVAIEKLRQNIESKRKFDLTIEDNATYVVGGAVVHNSPETTTTGEALKFYAGLRLRTSTQKKIENKKLGTVIGVNLKIKNNKNRFCEPFKEAEGVQLFFKQGVNPLSGLLTCLEQAERIEKVGGMYQVKEPFAGGQEIKFRGSKARNDVDAELLFKCPALIDAKNEQEVKDYLSMFGDAISQTLSDDTEEKEVARTDFDD